MSEGEASPPVAEIVQVQVAYGEVLALRGLSLAVRRGEMFGLVGPDGAGKTTAIRTLLGLLPTTGGRVRVLGADPRGPDSPVKRAVGYLSQRFTLYGDLTVDENIEFFGEIHRVPDLAPRRDALLAFTLLGPYRDRRADQLSGGMQKKLALACTLIHRPRLLLLDEPTTGVDPVSRREFWALLHRLLQDGLSVLLTTPYLDEAERCTRVALAHAGRTLAEDDPQALRRDPRTLAVLVLVPSLMLVLFGYVLSFDVRHISLCLVDHDRSAQSRALVAALTQSEYFDLVHVEDDPAAAQRRLDRGEATVALVLPPGLHRQLARGELATLQAVVDGSNANAAQTALAYLNAFATVHGAALLAAQGLAGGPPVELRQTVLYNPELKSERFLVPGLIAFVLMISCTVATALSIVRERETGTMEQLLVSPLTPAQVILGKSLPYAGVSVLATVLVLLTGVGLFDVEVRGSLWWLGLASLLFILGAQGLGLLISPVTTSQQLAFMLATFITLLPTFLLSGFVFPIENMPAAIQQLTYAIPLRYFLSIVRGVFLKGVGLAELWPQAVGLAVIGSLLLGGALLRFRRRLD